MKKVDEAERYKEENNNNAIDLSQKSELADSVFLGLGHMNDFSRNSSPGRGYSLNKVILFLEKLDSKSLISLIEGEEDIGIISFILDNILWRDKKYAEDVIKKINLEKLMKKIFLEESLEKINFLVSRISWLSREINLEFLKKFDIISLARKIDREQNLETVCQTLFEFYVCNEEMARELLDEINFEPLLWKVIVERDFEKVAMLIYCLYLIYGKFSKNLSTIVGAKVEKEDSLERVIEFLFKLRLSKNRFEGKLNLLNIKKREQEPANFEESKSAKNSCIEDFDINILKIIVEKIDLEILARKIDLEPRFEKIFEFISGIAKLNKEISIELLSKINIEYLVLKYEEIFR